ncbi:MAG: DMT family transporter [Pirellulales bacterium]
MKISDTSEPVLPRPGTGRLLILAATLLWSTNGLFAKSPTFDSWPLEARGTMLAFWRAAFAGLLILPAVRRPRWDARLVPMTIAFTAMNVCFLKSMTMTTAANAIWLQSTAPLWVFVCGLLFWRSSLDRRDAVPLACGLAGVATILYFELDPAAFGTQQAGVLYGLASGVFYAGVVMFLRALSKHNSAWLVALNHLVAAAVLIPLGFAHQITGMQFLVLAAFGLVQMGLPYLLFARGLRAVSSQEGALIGLTEPVMSPLWVFLAHGEQPAWWTLLGGALILAGLLARYWRKKEET